jgi:transposase
MLTIAGHCRIFFHLEAVDLRKGFEGLSTTVELKFKEKLTTGAYFVFLNKRQNTMKVLYYDQDGLAIWHKRLEVGKFSKKRIETQQITRREFLIMLEGITPKKLQKRWEL